MCDAGDPAADASGLRGAAPIAAAVPKALNESINHTYTELLHRFDKLLLEGAQLLGMSEHELQAQGAAADEDVDATLQAAFAELGIEIDAYAAEQALVGLKLEKDSAPGLRAHLHLRTLNAAGMRDAQRTTNPHEHDTQCVSPAAIDGKPLLAISGGGTGRLAAPAVSVAPRQRARGARRR